MTKKELYLKTVFCCIACDGDIAEEEIGLIRELGTKDKLFSDMGCKIILKIQLVENKEVTLFVKLNR